MKMLRTVITMLLPFLLIACATTVKNPAPLPLESKLPAAASEYLIQPGDQLDIKFFYNPELNESVMVRPDGRIALQLIKEIEVSGKTAQQLNDELTTKYAPHIKTPEVTVLVRSFSSEKVFVDGEVNRSGLVSLARPMTALQAISQAGGPKLDTALMEDVIVIRNSGRNEKITLSLNLKAALDGSDPKQDLQLQPYDIVFVPRTAITNADVWVDQYIRKLIPITLGAGFYKSNF
ncbi:MAG TPA: polysaccharide biosynthesis/export family protein [Geomonas sp.]|nr:polysaccharide biosynthesis/export family protein [Geomonas sp.]